jgi:hypothetical protein
MKQTRAKDKAKNRAKRRAALKTLAGYEADVIIPAKPQKLPEAKVEELLDTVTSEVQKRQIGELISSAMAYRQVGVRALARRIKRSHSQIIALEQASNLELRTLLSIADSLDFDVELKLIPREGGQALQAEL